ncbi:hypothetical protein HY572_05440 [Candidatus Micrarchaeota archaeon]|nr:hypothetical protein [Candidatus Micrarchaeota archaeon]
MMDHLAEAQRIHGEIRERLGWRDHRLDAERMQAIVEEYEKTHASRQEERGGERYYVANNAGHRFLREHILDALKNRGVQETHVESIRRALGEVLQPFSETGSKKIFAELRATKKGSQAYGHFKEIVQALLQDDEAMKKKMRQAKQRDVRQFFKNALTSMKAEILFSEINGEGVK